MTDEKHIQLSDETISELGSLREEFVAKFGREPTDDDPILFDPDADYPRPLSQAKMTAITLSAMVESGMPDALIFAFDRTGLILSEQTLAEADEDVRQEWTDSMATWSDMSRQRRRAYIRSLK
jgi:hypothetical protein